MINLSDNVNTIFLNLEKFLKTETVVGEPIKVGETVLIPLITVSFGCGAGGGTGNGTNGNDGGGGGLGSSARITPNAVLVVKNDEVTVLPIKNKNSLGNLIEMVPEIVEKISKKAGCCKASNEAAEEKPAE